MCTHVLFLNCDWKNGFRRPYTTNRFFNLTFVCRPSVNVLRAKAALF
ncbi:hypothetical protein NEIFLAOT_02327 [Neisseria flavescens NRL30031/H210]|uniref:Uncharacterized protein n=1 Tax=Neisseria flavescens NRL30031/H210 TaxID=546264 RepID=C0EQT2_NEIFL|nr:hypothetical protein NEIFLAOT_02327 [Neisseria flavescens NRL30031/H210]